MDVSSENISHQQNQSGVPWEALGSAEGQKQCSTCASVQSWAVQTLKIRGQFYRSEGSSKREKKHFFTALLLFNEHFERALQPGELKAGAS